MLAARWLTVDDADQSLLHPQPAVHAPQGRQRRTMSAVIYSGTIHELRFPMLSHVFLSSGKKV
jgi:hypothetical protein